MSDQEDGQIKRYWFRAQIDKTQQQDPWDYQSPIWYYNCKGCGERKSRNHKAEYNEFCPECLERLRKVIKRQKELEDL